jgi:hypothetical protein
MQHVLVVVYRRLGHPIRPISKGQDVQEECRPTGQSVLQGGWRGLVHREVNEPIRFLERELDTRARGEIGGNETSQSQWT